MHWWHGNIQAFDGGSDERNSQSVDSAFCDYGDCRRARRVRRWRRQRLACPGASAHPVSGTLALPGSFAGTLTWSGPITGPYPCTFTFPITGARSFSSPRASTYARPKDGQLPTRIHAAIGH